MDLVLWEWYTYISGLSVMRQYVWKLSLHYSFASATVQASLSGSHWKSGGCLIGWYEGHLGALPGRYQGLSTFQQGPPLLISHLVDHPHLHVEAHHGSRQCRQLNSLFPVDYTCHHMWLHCHNFLEVPIHTACTDLASWIPNKVQTVAYWLTI